MIYSYIYCNIGFVQWPYHFLSICLHPIFIRSRRYDRPYNVFDLDQDAELNKFHHVRLLEIWKCIYHFFSICCPIFKISIKIDFKLCFFKQFSKTIRGYLVRNSYSICASTSNNDTKNGHFSSKTLELYREMFESNFWPDL